MKESIIDTNVTYYSNGEKVERSLVFKEFDDVIRYMDQNKIEYEILEDSKYFLILRADHNEPHKYNCSYWHCAKKGVISYNEQRKVEK